MRFSSILFLFFAALAAGPLPAQVAPAPANPPATDVRGTLTGSVRTSDDQPVAGATVRLVGTTRQAATDAAGAFRFDRLPPGDYLLEVGSDRFGSAAAAVQVSAGATATVEVTLDLAVHREEIVVSASTDPSALSDVAQPVGVLADEDLANAARASLGETLSTQPGVNATSFGQGASRPIIRGQGGNRVRILENGVSSSDASDTSPDHAVALEPLAAEKVEVVRGPATLLYGSNAIGGVVNVLDQRIPDHLPSKTVEGDVSLVGTTNADERTGAAALDGRLGSNLAWRASGFRRESGDYESADGPVPNSDLESDGASLGLSWVGEDAYLGVSGRRYDSNYGNPAEEDVRIDLRQRRYDLQGALNRPLGVFDGVRLRAGSSDYEHVELEGSEVGTRFVNDAWEARVDATHQPFGAFRGSLGVQLSSRDFAAIGEEAFVPPTQNDSAAVFLFEEVGSGRLTGQLGLRFERQESSAEGQPSRDFAGTSVSVGGVYRFNDAVAAVLTVSRSVKIPDPEQLYANGPHVATQVFEIGDPNLDEETTLGADLGLRYEYGRLHGEVSVFTNRADDYIFEQFTGEFSNGDEEEHDEGEEGEGEEGEGGHHDEPLPIVRFVQADAEFWGVEAHNHIELLHAEPHHVELELQADMVRAELRRSGEPLPRIPPHRFSGGLRYRGERLSGSFFVRRVQDQDRAAAFETTTRGYTAFDATIGYRLFHADMVHELLLSGTNLNDALALNHASFLKEVAPLPGRDVRLTYRLSF